MKETNQTEDSNSPVCFEDTATAFKHKSNRELLLSYLIFGLTKSPFLVKFLSQAAKFALAIGLPVKPFIKATVFKQFCGGEKKEEYSKVITELGKADVGTILDYSVEGTKDEDGFEDTTKQLLQIVEQSKSDPNIPCTCMKMTAIGSFDLFKKVSANETLTKEDQLDLNKVKIRLEKICNASKEADKPIYIDAEETWIQGAIDRLAEEMMAKYNQNRAIVFTTLQLYRWDRNDYFKQLILQARSGGYKLGIKIVRGAYLEKERERARRLRYKSPINDTKADTDREYNKAVEIFIDNIDVVEICVGTHNEESCKLLIQTMAELELPNNHPHIYFSQLYGLSDNISFNLANAGYNVSKYLPFGPVESTLPYLARRAEENTAIAGQMSKELEIIISERKRRKSAQ
ncbi:MAG: proline dehydrogenase family protein [Deltaproteobacteria bacterium]|nr:proline dehydrogenase family protein [Deltaproteobacteria bacterium]